MMYDYVIIGAGISGVAFARILQMSGIHNIVLLEANESAGGLCRTRQVGRHVLDTGGGHFLCSRYPEVYDFIFSHIDKSRFNYFRRVSKIEISGFEIDYPIESNLWQLPAAVCADYLISVLHNGETMGRDAPDNYEAWIRWKLGDMIADNYMLPYNRKIWGVESSEMDIDWLYKIPRLDVREIAIACLNREQNREKMPSHSGFYYPREGGFQTLFDAIAKPVEKLIRTNVRAKNIDLLKDGTLVVNGQYHARKVINTAPWHTLSESSVFDGRIKEAIGGLRNNQLVVSLYEEPYKTDAHWVYLPEEKLPHHRSFYIANFAPQSASDGIYRETNIRRWKAGHGEIFSNINEYAYPIPTLGWSRRIQDVIEYCGTRNIHGLGRWGQWQYFNSDVCIREAMLLARKLGCVATSPLVQPVAR
jgi:protoporphyrinogen oxidase